MNTQPHPQHTRPRRLPRMVIRWAVRAGALLLLLLLLTGGYYWLSTDLPTPEHLRARAARGNTRVLDRHGRLLHEIPDPFGGWQRPIPLHNIPLALRQATIAVEDRSFYDNSGIDGRGIVRAAWENIRGGTIVAGGSTITQQLARTFLLDPDLAYQRTFHRKLRETVLALKLTTHLPKDAILALYLNQTYYGGMSYGVEAAAQHYFGKPARDLDLAECALLAGLPQAPTAYNPLLNREAALARQAQVLDAMVEAGFITPAQAHAAQQEPLTFASRTTVPHAPHAVYFVLNQLARDIPPDVIARGGLTITTTIDLDLQTTAEARLQHHIALLSTPRDGEPDHQVENGAVVVLDPASGNVLAMVGSPDFADTAIQGQVNATVAPRQPGSAIKPLTYAAALERGWTPAMLVRDEPVSFPTREGRPYTPENYDGRYHGLISVREALATSSNVAAVRVLHDIGVPALLDMASRLGITHLQANSSRYGLALTLGGGEVTLLELTTAYATFANGGQRVAPVVVRSLTGPGGVRQPDKQQHGEQVLSPQVAYLISDILSDRYARMRAFGAWSVLDIDRPAAVKTGTTTDWRDNWTVGYTPDRVVGVWVGNADGRPMESVSGVAGAGPVWHDVMLAAHHGLPPRPFPQPDGIVEIAICAETGLLPTPACPTTRLERFLAGTQPTTASAGAGVGETTGQTGENAPREQPAPEGPATPTRRPAPQHLPTLVSPAPGAVFSMSGGVPRHRQQVLLRARTAEDTTRLTFLVDGEPVAVCDSPPWQAFWPLAPGQHQLLVVAQDGQGNTRRSEAVVIQVQVDK